MLIESAYDILNRSIIECRGEPVGTTAAVDPNPAAAHYHECFIRDFVPSALVFLFDGRTDIVRNFLTTVMKLRGLQPVPEGHQRSMGLMPASFRVGDKTDGAPFVGDFGERAIGRVIPVDSAMWWLYLLRAYVVTSNDWELMENHEIQQCVRQVLELYLRESFESAPTLLVPDGSFMIDRRMGVHGYPLEIQALFYGMLLSVRELLAGVLGRVNLLRNLDIRIRSLREHVRVRYWVDRGRLNEIHRFKSEEFGLEATNVLNVYPESIPDWMDGWLDSHCGYLVGNQGPGKVDFRFFAQGNLLSILFDLATEEESAKIMSLYELHWDDLIGEMPAKIVYPAVSEREWMYMTGSDPKNAAWSYHNGGNWPVLLWPFVGAALTTGRRDLAQRAIDLMAERIERDNWPEYYDGRKGGLIGRRSNLFQTWTATAYIVARKLMEDPETLRLFDTLTFSNIGGKLPERGRGKP
jgi:glycogen debranching enzyme